MPADAYLDLPSITRLGNDAAQAPRANLREVAGQFESLFAHMLLKSMRSASFGDAYFDSNQSKFYRDLFDQQMSVELTKGRGLGLADILVDQLERFVPDVEVPEATVPDSGSIAASKKDFVRTLLPLARKAGTALGVAPEAILSQAALETGWGTRVMRNGQGQSTHNLFGIKADSSWKGERTFFQTLEQVGDIAEKRSEPFRVYSTMEQAFDDYVSFLKTNPRYKKALKQPNAEGFIQGIHKAGYATDPDYGKKIIDILRGETMSKALSSVGKAIRSYGPFSLER